LIGPRMVRTGVDLGSESVKLLVGEGNGRLERILHAGIEPWDPPETRDDAARASGALGRLLKRLNLKRRQLGRIAVGINGIDSSLREICLPTLTEPELRRALPYEARKHLFIEGMADPALDCQILGEAPPSDDGAEPQIRVLLAAVPGSARAFPLTVLGRVGLEPEVVDLEPLALLNAVVSICGAQMNGGAICALDLGSRQAVMHLTARSGGVLSRPVGPGVPSSRDDDSMAGYADEIIERVRETATFYRGRHRLEVDRMLVGGGGAMLPGMIDRLCAATDRPVELLDPFKTLTKTPDAALGVGDQAPRFATACGLCRWWDDSHV
jgi:Tfp pilus assembly PilM family ATPase